MRKQNPYQATLVAESSHASSRAFIALWWLVYLHPMVTLVLIYASWLLTMVSLGHPPGFGEHPENDVVHSLVHCLELPAALLMIASLVFVPMAMMWGLTQPFALPAESAMLKQRLLCPMFYVLMLGLVMVVAMTDPWGVMDWFLD